MVGEPVPPVARKVPRRISQLGRVREDDYAWMKDDNWQALLRDPTLLRADIRDHLEAENDYTEAVLAPTKTLQAEILAEMTGRIKQDDASVPVPDGAWEYYYRYEPGAQHPLHARRPRGAQGGEEVLLDAEAQAKGRDFFRVGAARHSPDHSLFAYAEDTQGSEAYRIRIKDLASGEVLAHSVESATGSFAFSADSSWLFWVFRNDNGRPSRVYRRPARGGAGDDALVYEEPDEGFFLSVVPTDSYRFLVIACGNQQTSEARLIPADRAMQPARLVEPRTDGVRYEVEHWNGRFIIRTNADGAIDFKLVEAPQDDPGRRNWRDWISHEPGRFIAGMAAFAGHFVRLERVDANNRIVITEHGSQREQAVSVGEEAYVLGLAGGFEYETTVLRYTYESPTTPRRWFDLDMRTGARTLRKTQQIPSGHDPARYVARRLHARAPDGAEVPVTVLMRSDAKTDGSAPLFLNGYGAYGYAFEPVFSIRSLSLVDRGWLWAIAHVRGGSEKGWGWFLEGRGSRKTNTFSDFVAAAEHLIEHGYGRRGAIIAAGRSAGGLLMGAVANLRPDLWAGIIAGVPFVDTLNTMSDASLPLTPPEWPEWGNPLTDEQAYDAIASYSPYDNVGHRAYPAVLATGGLSDPRVTYWEPAKWVARLRAMTASGEPVLLKTNMQAGHGGAAGRFASLRETALELAFAIWLHERG